MEPNVIVVEQEHAEELAACGADFHVVVRGSNLVAGDAAVEKAGEVAALAAAVVRAGVRREDVSILGVQAHVESGVFSKSTSASYSVRVRCDAPELFTDVLAAVVGQKNVELSHVGWRYDEAPEHRARRLHACAAEARRMGEAIAAGLDVVIVGVHRVREAPRVGAQPPSFGGDMPAGVPPAARARASIADLGMQVAPTKRVTVSLAVELLVEAKPRAGAG